MGRKTNRTFQVQVRVMADDPELVLKFLKAISKAFLVDAKVTGVYRNRKNTEPYSYRGYVEGTVDVERFD